MKRPLLSVSFALVVFVVAQAASAQPVRVGSVAESRFGTGWTLDGSEMTNTRAKLLDPANFGTGGTFPRPIVITDTAASPGSVDAALLSAFDVFFIGYLNDSSFNAFQPSELVAFQAWVNAGGTMIVTCDDNNYDAVCASFGHPSASGSVNPILPTAAGVASPLFHGAFGTVPSVLMSGTKGQFTSTTGATVLAVDSSSTPKPTILIRQVGNGRVVLMADVDLIANALSAGSGISNNNDHFMGNLFAFVANCSQTGLCLSNSRFQVTADWVSPSGSGHGQAVPLTADTGYFWFFSASNVEMVVKVLDACGLNSKKWVFAGGLTNVDVTVTVTDLFTNAVKVYHNPQNTPFQPIQDTSAFATCP